MVDRTRLDQIAAPYGREVRLDEMPYESGMRLLRITIREGRRFTVLDLDAESAATLGSAMVTWSERHADCGGGGNAA